MDSSKTFTNEQMIVFSFETKKFVYESMSSNRNSQKKRNIKNLNRILVQNTFKFATQNFDFIFNTEFKQLQACDNHSRLVKVLALRAGGRGRHRPDKKEDTQS